MQKVKLNIVPKGVKKTTYLSQNDNGRVVRYELFNELLPYTLDGSETITLKVVRPDGEEILTSIENTFEGKAYIDVSFNDDMSAITGVGAGEIKIKDGETELGSHNFDINVESDAYNGKDVVIETETGTLLSFNTEVEDNALEYESEIPYNADGYTGLRVINTRTAPVYDKTPYLFRKTPSGYGNSCIEKLNGLTVAFNQLVQNGNFSDTSIWQAVRSTLTVSGNIGTITNDSSNPYIEQRYNFIANHKYLYLCELKAEADGSVKLESYYDNEVRTKNYTVSQTVWTQAFFIISPSLSGTENKDRYRISVLVGSSAQVKNANLIDLTQMFGSTIADYIYSLETAQAGAGVDYFKILFGADYYPYNAGELISVKTSGRKTIGFNQFDKTTATLDKVISTNGAEAVYNNFAHSDYIRALPNTIYYVSNTDASTDVSIFANYNSSKEFIGFSGGYNGNQKLRQTLSNTAYIIVNMKKSVMDDINVNISDPAKDGQYEPYSEETYNLGGDELRGLLKLDANNNIYAYGDTKTSDGNIKRKFGIVDLGSLSYERNTVGDYIVFRGNISDKAINTNSLCTNYLNSEKPRDQLNDKEYGTWNVASSMNNIVIRDDSKASLSASDFKTAMNGVYLVYELETPTTESADPYTDPQEVKITEEFIDNRAIPIPVGHDTIYGTDIEYQDIDFNTTIYGGEIDAVNGVLSSEYNSDGSVKTTPEIIDITPTPIPVKAGDNKIFNSANGNQTIRYYNQVEE